MVFARASIPMRTHACTYSIYIYIYKGSIAGTNAAGRFLGDFYSRQIINYRPAVRNRAGI